MIGLRICLIGAALAAGLVSARAAPPPEVAQCAGCHGANGMGNPASNFPALAGQPAGYLEQQLYAFKHETRRSSTMKSFAAGLNAAQRQAIAAYYSQLKPVAPASLPAAPTDKLGETIAMHGLRTAKGMIPACDSCHGAGGMGMASGFPRLAGQTAPYLASQLEDWRKGARNESNMHLMRNVAVMLSPAQVKAVAAYFASLSPAPTGK
ncbi:MAG: c-type cytochrome [Acidiphilium sp.]